MNLSIVVPTRNRPGLLADMLRSLSAAKPSGLSLEVLVVDNNSSPELAPRVADAARVGTLPVRLLSEPRPGQSAAINRGIREARGAVVAFLDDDIVVHETYLLGVEEAIRDLSGSVFGGRVVATWRGPQPGWINGGRPLETSYGPIVAHDRGDAPQPYAPGTPLPVGCNFFCRRELFERYGEFDERLGPGAAPGILGGGETDRLRRFQAGGEPIWYVPRAAVDHPVPFERMTKRHFRYRFFCAGRSIPYLQRPGLPTWLGVPRYLYPLLVATAGRSVARRIAGRTASALEDQFKACEIAGAIYEFRRVRRGAIRGGR